MDIGLYPISGRILIDQIFAGEMRSFSPYILHVARGHFVVVIRSYRNKLLLADPAVGVYTLARHRIPGYCIGSDIKDVKAVVICFLPNREKVHKRRLR